MVVTALRLPAWPLVRQSWWPPRQAHKATYPCPRTNGMDLNLIVSLLNGYVALWA